MSPDLDALPTISPDEGSGTATVAVPLPGGLGPLSGAFRPLSGGSIFTPEMEAAADAIIAHGRGDEEAFWSWVEKVVGSTPDELLRGMLEREYVHQLNRLPIPIAIELLRYHARRLDSPDPVRWYDDQMEYVRGRLKTDEGKDLMQSLKGVYGESEGHRRAGLPDEIRGVLRVAEAEGYCGGRFIGKHFINKVAELIIDYCRTDLQRTEGGRPGQLAREEAATARKRLQALLANGGDYLEVARALRIAEEHQSQAREAFLARCATHAEISSESTEHRAGKANRQIDSLRKKAGLTPRQSEFLDLRKQGYSIKEIADHWNAAEGTVRKHRDNTYEKLRRVAG